MTAIVLDHEQPHEKARGRHRQQQAEPVAEIERRPHQNQSRTSGPAVIDELDDAARKARLAIADEDLRPAAGVGRNRGRRSMLMLSKVTSLSGQKKHPQFHLGRAFLSLRLGKDHMNGRRFSVSGNSAKFVP